MATLDELHQIVTEMELYRPSTKSFQEALSRLSKWNREWANQNKRSPQTPTVGCPKCGEQL